MIAILVPDCGQGHSSTWLAQSRWPAMKPTTGPPEPDDLSGDEHATADDFAAVDPISYGCQRLQRPQVSKTVVTPRLGPPTPQAIATAMAMPSARVGPGMPGDDRSRRRRHAGRANQAGTDPRDAAGRVVAVAVAVAVGRDHGRPQRTSCHVERRRLVHECSSTLRAIGSLSPGFRLHSVTAWSCLLKHNSRLLRGIPTAGGSSWGARSVCRRPRRSGGGAVAECRTRPAFRADPASPSDQWTPTFCNVTWGRGNGEGTIKGVRQALPLFRLAPQYAQSRCARSSAIGLPIGCSGNAGWVDVGFRECF
jgi:hypothetical protein